MGSGFRTNPLALCARTSAPWGSPRRSCTSSAQPQRAAAPLPLGAGSCSSTPCPSSTCVWVQTPTCAYPRCHRGWQGAAETPPSPRSSRVALPGSSCWDLAPAAPEPRHTRCSRRPRCDTLAWLGANTPWLRTGLRFRTAPLRPPRYSAVQLLSCHHAPSPESCPRRAVTSRASRLRGSSSGSAPPAPFRLLG